jgi:hypothetical protein
MGLESGRSQIAGGLGSNLINLDTSQNYGVVYEVLLDVDTQTAKNKGLSGASAIGAIRFRGMGSTNVNTNEQLPIAFPIDKNSNTLPTKNEIVVIHNLGGNWHYSRIGGDVTPNVNTVGNVISSKFVAKDELDDSSSKSKTYNDVSQTNISRTNQSSNTTEYDGYGVYFEPQQNIHKLKLYEGDTLIESRFGQSIRFSGYNNAENVFAPTLIIRNGENADSLLADIGISTEEDVNKDGNIIFLGSGDKLLEYTLPITNKKESFFNYPNELKGNQILLNSDRIILSAKTAEMIGVAKKDIGFITDGQFSIDATQGINITTEAGIFVDTKNRDVNFNVGNGTIALGTDGQLEAAVKGETLKDILYDFMVIVAQQIFVTPSGPTAPGPTNNPEINALVTRLNDMLSNHIQLK